MQEGDFDYLVCVAIDATRGMSADEPGEVVLLDWYGYDIKKRLVADEKHFFVKVNKMERVDDEVLKGRGISREKIQQAEGLGEVIKKFNAYIFQKFVMENQSFCLVTHEREPMEQLIEDALSKGIKLAYHFLRYFVLIDEFTKYAGTNGIGLLKGKETKVGDMLELLGLKPIQQEGPTITIQVQNMIRIINRLVKDAHPFLHPTEYHQRQEPSRVVIPEQHRDERAIRTEERLFPYEEAKLNQRERSRERQLITQPVPDIESVGTWRNAKPCYVRIKGFPWGTQKSQIQNFFYNIRIAKEGISFHHDEKGVPTGEAVVKLFYNSDLQEALGFNKRRFHYKFMIDVLESNEEEMSVAIESEQRRIPLEKNAKYYQCNTPSRTQLVNANEYVALRMRGLPWNVSMDDVYFFFSDYKVVKGSAKLGLNQQGRRTGEAVILFKSADEAERALSQKQGHFIGKRWIELFLLKFQEYNSFENSLFDKQHASSFTHLMNPDTKDRTLKIKGLPFNSSEEDLCSFFKGYEVVSLCLTQSPQDIVIEKEFGKMTGISYVTLKSAELARHARTQLNMQYMGKRYLELFLMNE